MKDKYLKPELEFIELEKVYTDESLHPSLDNPEDAGGDAGDPDGETNTEQNTNNSKGGGENTNEWDLDAKKEEEPTKTSVSPDTITDALKQGVSEILSDVSGAITGSLEEIGQEESPEGDNAEKPIEGEITTESNPEETTSGGFLDEGQE